MENPKNFSPGTFAIIFLLLAGLLYICVWPPSISNPFLSYQETNCPSSNFNTTGKFLVKDELDLALDEASMPNKTVIIAVVNRAYVEQTVNSETTMLDLFLESFWLGDDTRALLDHLLLVTVDQTAYDRCKFKRFHCYRLVTDGVDFGGEKVYMSQDFIKMMWRRTLFLLEVLRRGYNFIFTYVIRSPFTVKDSYHNVTSVMDEFNATAFTWGKFIEQSESPKFREVSLIIGPPSTVSALNHMNLCKIMY